MSVTKKSLTSSKLRFKSGDAIGTANTTTAPSSTPGAATLGRVDWSGAVKSAEQ